MNATKIMTELKPCPFCGNSPSIGKSSIVWGHGEPQTPAIKCKSCGLEMTDYALSIEGLAERWNTRPIDDAVKARMDKLLKDMLTE